MGTTTSTKMIKEKSFMLEAKTLPATQVEDKIEKASEMEKIKVEEKELDHNNDTLASLEKKNIRDDSKEVKQDGKKNEKVNKKEESDTKDEPIQKSDTPAPATKKSS